MNDITSGFDLTEHSQLETVYQVVRIIYESKSGCFRLLEVTHGGRIFAAKTLKPEYRNSSPHQEILKKEFKILSSLYHPSVVQAFEIVDIEGEGLALILEYAYGVTLEAYLKVQKPTYDKSIQILEQICSGVDYCHKRGVIHRDLKPSNIIIYAQGPVVKIIDFNLSHSPSFTSPPLPGGTKGFSCPEEFNPVPPALPSSDIWSIGKLMEVIQPKGNRRWQRVKNKCMHPMPEHRPASAALIPGMLKEKTFSWRHLVAVALLFIILAGGLSFFFFRQSEKTPEGIAMLDSDVTDDSIFSPKNEPALEIDSIAPLPTQSIDAETSLPSKTSPDTLPGTFDYKNMNTNDLSAIVKIKAEEAANKRFKEQLAILDTATNRETFTLARAGHWRWKAKQDVESWLNSVSISNSTKQELRALAEIGINRFGEAHTAELIKAFQDAFYDRKVNAAFGVIIKDEKYLGNGQYLIKEMGEDGEIKTHIEVRDL